VNRKLSRFVLVIPFLLTPTVWAASALAQQADASKENQTRRRDPAVGRQLGEAVRLIPKDPEQADHRLDKLAETDSLLEDVITYYRGAAVMGSDPEKARRRFEQVIADQPPRRQPSSPSCY
jgi:hypothetical protein